MAKKIVIVGAGIAGLSAGVFGQLNGFGTEIYEKQAVAGGECTGWNRSGYHFDGCIHWLVGSKPGTPVNKLLREIGALDDSIGIVNNEYFYRAEADGQTVNMYTNVDRLEAHLTELSPQDAPLIRDMCKAIRTIGKLDMPIDKPMEMYSAFDNLKMLPKMLPVMGLMKKYSAVTIGEFADQFKHPLIRDAFKQSYPNDLIALLPLMIFSSLNDGDSGIPMGGSKKLAQRIAKRYSSLGGKIHYNVPVDRIKVEKGKAVGVVLADGSEVQADVVVSAADGNFTLTHLLEGKYRDEKLETLFTERSTYPTVTSVHISVGVACDLSEEPHTICFKLAHPIDAGGFIHEWLRLDHYCYDRSFAPEGKSVVESAFLVADYDWWKQKAQNKEAYDVEKQRVAREVCAAIETRFPQAKDKIEVVDIATPVTYERYCNAWRGSYMSWGPTPKSKIRSLTGKLEGLEGFYMAGQWTMLPGINGAAITGKWAIQRICKDQKISFRE
jgi:phytoene desaturase